VNGPGRDPRYDSDARVNPPLRTEDDRRALVRAVNEGVIDAIATDHAPHAIEDKLCEFDLAAPGISCFETAAGTLFTQVERGELHLAAVVSALTERPARTFALDARVPGLGTLATGAPADIVVIDPARRWTVDVTRFASKGRNTPLRDANLVGAVRATIVGGRLEWDAGVLDG
jgi:dihydroorotase